MAVFWVVAPCEMLQVYQRFTNRPDDGGGKDIKKVVNSYQSTRRYNPEDSRLPLSIAVLPVRRRDCDRIKKKIALQSPVVSQRNGDATAIGSRKKSLCSRLFFPSATATRLRSDQEKKSLCSHQFFPSASATRLRSDQEKNRFAVACFFPAQRRRDCDRDR
jgi:hypothetical protein